MKARLAKITAMIDGDKEMLGVRKKELNVNPLGRPITKSEESWLVSLQILGSLIGTILVGYCSRKFGCKKSLIISSIPFAIGQLLIAHSKCVALFCIARVVTGACVIFSIGLIPGYVADIAMDHNRGFLSSVTGTTISVANLMNFSIGTIVSIRTMAYIVLSIMVLFLVTFVPFIPDSPQLYIGMHKNKRAEEILKKVRSNSNDEKGITLVDNLLLTHENIKDENAGENIFKSSSTRNGLIICCSLFLFQLFTGYALLSLYLQTIIKASNDIMPPYTVSVTIGILQMLACVISNTFIDKLGRKNLLYISSAGCSSTIISLGIYFYLKKLDYNTDCVFWLPLVALSLNFVSFDLGWSQIPLIISGEVFTSNIKYTCISISIGFATVLAFVIGAGIPFLLELLGMDVIFFACGVITMIAFVFVMLYVPETKVSPECPDNEIRGCIPCCPDPTCEKPKPNCPFQMCTMECRFTCRCDGELIRDTATNKCVKESDCSK
ncbi:unnamed protein product [Psylliodes chrysocephalus]|uniref:Major facilitator superfamily (MFS) profile domain-containing protein n=1 Tax=Psylliodes chrysocephalus TaxID=3402493 RepID=A0A9P0CW11_9CUCU|nr:unnamed protein product [Psylliodes chrysocephala]